MNEAIILAGGLGTRLSSVVTDVPKPLAPVQGRPALSYVLDQISLSGVNRVILAVAYKHELIEAFYGDSYKGMALTYSVEETPLGTGGGLMKAACLIEGEYFLACNADTLLSKDYRALSTSSLERRASTLLVMKERHATRFGAVAYKKTGKVVAFNDSVTPDVSSEISHGISVGSYVFNIAHLKNCAPPSSLFSLEDYLLPQLCKRSLLFAQEYSGLFIDIGVPDDYFLAQNTRELKG